MHFEKVMHSIDIERFHNDAKAAVIAEIPLVGEEDRLTVGQLEQLQPQIQAITIDDSPSNAKLRTEIFQNEALPKWYRATSSQFS